MNFLRMQNMVRQLVGEVDSTNTYHTTTEVKDMINDACVSVADATECLLTFIEFPTSAGDYRFPLPEDFMKARSCEIDVSATLRHQMEKVSFDYYNQMVGGNVTMQGQPAYWKIEIGATGVAVGSNAPGDLWVYPRCDDNGGSDYTIRFYYHQIPTALDLDTDTSELPVQLHIAVCYFAAREIAEKSSDWGRIRRLDKKYYDVIGNFRQTMVKREARSFVPKNIYRARVLKRQGWR